MRTRIDGFAQAQRNYDAQEAPGCFDEEQPDNYPCARCDTGTVEAVWWTRSASWTPKRQCSGIDCDAALCRSCAHENEFCPKCKEET